MTAFFTTDLPAILGGVGDIVEFAATTFPINVAILAGLTVTLWGVAKGFLGGKGKTSVRRAR